MTKGLYLHIPFCDSLCYYCDFVKDRAKDEIIWAYVNHLKREIDQVDLTSFDTLYVGGGSPSLLSIDQIDLLFSKLKGHSFKEVTLEVNPDHVTLEKAKHYMQLGVNRISMGVQSSQDHFLKKLGRKHTFQRVLEARSSLKEAGFHNISYDLMYGLPGQSLEDLQKDLQAFLELDPVHLSLYSLTIEPNTLFSIRGVKGVSQDLETDMYLFIQSTLTKAGFDHYEISNFCRPGYASLHNLHYWHYDDFLGLGLGAASKMGPHRFQQGRKLGAYLADRSSLMEDLMLSDHEQMVEMLMMGFRLKEGVNKDCFYQRFGKNIDDIFSNQVKQLIDQGVLIDHKDRLCPSDNARMTLFDWFVDFMD